MVFRSALQCAEIAYELRRVVVTLFDNPEHLKTHMAFRLAPIDLSFGLAQIESFDLFRS